MSRAFQFGDDDEEESQAWFRVRSPTAAAAAKRAPPRRRRRAPRRTLYVPAATAAAAEAAVVEPPVLPDAPFMVESVDAYGAPVGKPLGAGAYGEVTLHEPPGTTARYAIKRERILEPRFGVPESVVREAAILRQLRGHPSVVDLRHVMIDTRASRMVMPAAATSLHALIGNARANGGVAEAPGGSGRVLFDRRTPDAANYYIALYMYQLLRGVAFFHARRVWHRDLKPANVLVYDEPARVDPRTQRPLPRAVVADFGLAQSHAIGGRVYDPLVYTSWYRPPEILLGSRRYAARGDVWAAGVIMLEMLLGGHPLPLFAKQWLSGSRGDMSEDAQLLYVALAHYNPAASDDDDDDDERAATDAFLRARQRSPNTPTAFRTGAPLAWAAWGAAKQPLPQRFGERAALLSADGADLLRSMLRIDPARRPKAVDLLAHPYFDAVRGAVELVYAAPPIAATGCAPTLRATQWRTPVGDERTEQAWAAVMASDADAPRWADHVQALVQGWAATLPAQPMCPETLYVAVSVLQLLALRHGTTALSDAHVRMCIVVASKLCDAVTLPALLPYADDEAAVRANPTLPLRTELSVLYDVDLDVAYPTALEFFDTFAASVPDERVVRVGRALLFAAVHSLPLLQAADMVSHAQAETLAATALALAGHVVTAVDEGEPPAISDDGPCTGPDLARIVDELVRDDYTQLLVDATRAVADRYETVWAADRRIGPVAVDMLHATVLAADDDE